jgi:hypothetical protein
LRNVDRLIGLLLAIGVLAAVFGLRACGKAPPPPAETPPTEMPRDL